MCIRDRGTEDDAVSKAEVLLSPLEGEVVPLKEVNDPTFAEEILGKGVAVRPAGGRVCAPAAGKLVSVFETGHAFGMITDHGAEVLVHVGLDTVNLKGKYFTVKKAAGDTVSYTHLDVYKRQVCTYAGSSAVLYR